MERDLPPSCGSDSHAIESYPLSFLGQAYGSVFGEIQFQLQLKDSDVITVTQKSNNWIFLMLWVSGDSVHINELFAIFFQ